MTSPEQVLNEIQQTNGGIVIMLIAIIWIGGEILDPIYRLIMYPRKPASRII